jgi:hypothetical protein
MRTRLGAPLLALLLLTAFHLQEDRKPVPDEKTQKEFDAIVREVFKDDFAKSGVPERKVLVGKLLKQASETKNDPPALYALLQHARTIAAQVADLKSGTQAVDELIKKFEVDPIALRKSFLTEAAKTARTSEELAAAAEGHLQLADLAASAESYADAQAAATAAAALAKRAKSIPLVNRADARVRELGEQKILGEVVQKAREALVKSPDDPLANFIVGRHECLSGNWPKGLLHLSKGSEAGWKNAATRDAVEPAAAAEQVPLADAWWDLAEKEKGPYKTLLQKRAALWYGRAESQVSGLTLVKVRKRLAEASTGVAGGEVLPAGVVASWAFEEGAGAGIIDARGGTPASAAGGISWAPGRVGKALKFDGASGHVLVTEADRFNFGKSGFTVACWINLAGTAHYRIVNRWDHPNLRGWLLDVNAGRMNPDGRAAAEVGHLRVRLSDGKTKLNYAADAGLKVGAWKHVAMTVDLVQKELKLYADGSQIGPAFPLKDLAEVDTTASLGIGTIPSQPGSYFSGLLDEFRIYREVLGASGIKALAERP